MKPFTRQQDRFIKETIFNWGEEWGKCFGQNEFLFYKCRKILEDELVGDIYFFDRVDEDRADEDRADDL